MFKTLEEKRAELNSLLFNLDDYCSLILAVISLHPEGLGFGVLYKEVRKKEKYKKTSKSAVSKHLKHLQKMNLVEKEIEEKSPLKWKPSNYHTSSYFRELSKGLVAQSVTSDDFIPLMMKEDVTEVTHHLMHISIQHLCDCLKTVLEAPENIAIWNIGQLCYNIEMFMKAYRERILKKNEVNPALKVINNCNTKLTKSLLESLSN